MTGRSLKLDPFVIVESRVADIGCTKPPPGFEPGAARFERPRSLSNEIRGRDRKLARTAQTVPALSTWGWRAGLSASKLEARSVASSHGHHLLYVHAPSTIGGAQDSVEVFSYSVSRRAAKAFSAHVPYIGRCGQERRKRPMGRFQEGAIDAARAVFRSVDMRRDYGTMAGGRMKHALFSCFWDGISDPAGTTSDAG